MIRALSSLGMTKLIEWRNKNSASNYNPSRNKRWSILKKVVAEPCFFILTVAAMVETVASIIFLVETIPLYFITIKDPYIFACKWLKSASFTYSWGSILLFYNFSKSTLISTEANAFNY